MDRAKHELLREGVGAATYAMCYVLCNAAVIKKKQIEYHGSGMIGGVSGFHNTVKIDRYSVLYVLYYIVY